MRVAILGSRGVPARYGGFEHFAERVALGLIDKGWEVHIFCPHYQEYQEPEYKGIKLEYTHHGGGVIGSVLYDILCIAKAAWQKHDVVLMLGYAASPLFWIPRIFGKKIAVNTDGFEWQRSKWPWYVRKYLRQAERIATKTANALISDSRAVQSYYEDTYGIDSTFIPYGADLPTGRDLSHFPEWGIKSGDFYSVVMRMEPENSIYEIVSGFSRSHSQRHLVLVGWRTEYFESQVMPMIDADPRIKFLGPIYDRERLFAVREESCAYIHGHSVGGTNPSLLDAVVSRNFVIARDVPFNREVVGESGMYFSSAEDLTSRIQQFEKLGADEIANLATQARDRVARDYTWESVVNDYEKLLTNLVE